MTDGLVRWANRYTRGFDNVQPVSDLTDSWANGLAFCALIHTYFPDKFPSPNTLKTDTRADRLNNFKLAFNFAENELSVEPYLDPEDCVDFQEEKSIALYLSVLYDALKNNIPGFFPSVEWTKKHDEAEMQKKLDEYKARMSGEAGKLGGSVPTSKGEKIFLNRQKNLESTAAESTMSEAERKKRDDEMAALLAARKAKAEQEAKEREEKRKADAERLKKIMEEQAAQPPKPLVEIADESGYSVQLKGEGASKTKVSTLTMFTAVIREQGQPPKNCNTDSLKMLFHGPDKKITAKIIGGTLGSFTVGFTPKQAGEYLMEVQFNGKVVGGPLPLIVTNADGSVLGGAAPSSPAATSTPTPTTTASTPAPKPATPVQPKEEPKPKDEPKPAKPTPNASKTVVEGLVSEASDLRTYSFTIVANDANDQRIKTGGDKFDATIDGPSVATARVEDNNDGTYKVFYSLTQAGDYKISVRVGGNHISGSPFAVRCFEDIKTVEVARCSMVVKVVTKSGKQKQEGGDGARLKAVCHNAKSGNLSTNITDNKNGTYTIEYAVASGKNTLDVQLDGKSLAGFPLSQVFNV